MSYSIKEAAEKISVSEITLRRIISKGAINYHKIGKIYRLTEDDINAYIKSVRNKNNVNNREIKSSGNINLNDEMINKIEHEAGDLRYGIVRFALHIVDGKLIRYTVSREQSVLLAHDDDHPIDHTDNEIEPKRVEKE